MPTYLPKIYLNMFFLHFDWRSDPDFFSIWAGSRSMDKNVGSSSLIERWTISWFSHLPSRSSIASSASCLLKKRTKANPLVSPVLLFKQGCHDDKKSFSQKNLSYLPSILSKSNLNPNMLHSKLCIEFYKWEEVERWEREKSSSK